MNRYPWSILGIEPTDDKREIKKAYARLLKTIDQKQDPQAFQKLREAYDQALGKILKRFVADASNIPLTAKAKESH